jgi:hypothetical protein
MELGSTTWIQQPLVISLSWVIPISLFFKVVIMFQILSGARPNAVVDSRGFFGRTGGIIFILYSLIAIHSHNSLVRFG